MDAQPQVAEAAAPAKEKHSLGDLPPYARSLLRIRLPVAVNLANKRETVKEILELGPGAIIKFNKPCDEMLQLSVGNIPVAEGDAVKVGDKFGLRINRILPPHERFRSVVCQRSDPSAKRDR